MPVLPEGGFMKNRKRMVSILLAVIMLISVLPASAFASNVKGDVKGSDSRTKRLEDISGGVLRVLDKTSSVPVRSLPLRGESYTISGIPENMEVTVDGVVVSPEADGTLVVASGSTVAFTAAKEYKIRSFFAEAENLTGDPQITLTAGDVWEDGSGYQLLLDADATAYGTVFPEEGPIPSNWDSDEDPVYGDVPVEFYNEFEYKIPENADGALTTENVVFENSVTITVPAGTYDWVILNPSAGDKMYVSSNNGNVDGRYDDFEFEEGCSYEFVPQRVGTGDGIFLTVLAGVEISYDAESAAYSFVMPEDNVIVNAVVTEITYLNEWDFEDYETQLEDWIIVDNDGDGLNWGLTRFDDAHSGEIVLYSQSYDSSYGALTPDNWAISGPVIVPEEDALLSFWMMGYPASFCTEVMGIYVGRVQEDLESYVQLGEDFVGTEAWEEHILDLSEYAGEVVYIAFRHYNCTNNYYLLLDDVKVYSGEMPEPPQPPAPARNPFWDFEEATDLDGWANVDQDGDNKKWSRYDTEGGTNITYHSPYFVMTSASYDSSGVLTPDNWLITPAIIIPDNDAQLSFWANGQDPDYAEEHLAIYIGASQDPSEMVRIDGGEDIVTTGEVTNYTYDLSAYAGATMYVAFRHYNVTDMFRVNIDDVEVTGTYNASEGVTVVPGPAGQFTEGTDFTVDGNVVTVTYSVPCRLGYLDGEGNYVAVSAVAVEGSENTYSFTVPEGVEEVVLVIKGDANQDGEFTNLDVTVGKAASLGRTNVPFTALGAFAADLSGEGEFTNYDVTLMKAASLGRYNLAW